MGMSLVRHGIVLVLVAAAPIGACRRSQGSSGVSDSTFVATVAELKRVNDAPVHDTAERAALRAAILQRRGLSPAQLEQAARDLARNPARAQEVWQAIERRAADTTKVP